MNREQKYTAIVLKKQTFNEGDEIITFYTKENGKIRCIAKSIKKSLAKLQQKLQTLFLVELEVTSTTKLPKIIRVEPIQSFSNLRENYSALKVAFLAIELLLKFTADEQKNEKLFNVFIDFINLLDSDLKAEELSIALVKFKIDVLEASGLALDFFPELLFAGEVYFSSARGGFSDINTGGSVLIDKKTLNLFLNIHSNKISFLENFEFISKLPELQNLLSQFIEYQLERNIKSEKFLNV